MNNVEFEILQRKIRWHQLELNNLQKRYKKQTGIYLSSTASIKPAKMCETCIFYSDPEENNSICLNAKSEFHQMFFADGCIEHIKRGE